MEFNDNTLLVGQYDLLFSFGPCSRSQQTREHSFLCYKEGAAGNANEFNFLSFLLCDLIRVLKENLLRGEWTGLLNQTPLSALSCSVRR